MTPKQINQIIDLNLELELLQEPHSKEREFAASLNNLETVVVLSISTTIKLSQLYITYCT